MTQKIIICILLLVTLSPGRISATEVTGKVSVNKTAEMHTSDNTTGHQQRSTQGKIPAAIPHASNQDAHGKSARVPHMEEIPHIHRYHKERVKKARVHHSGIWIIAKALVVICHLSLLWIAYMHLTH